MAIGTGIVLASGLVGDLVGQVVGGVVRPGYEALLKSRRKELHRLVARAIDQFVEVAQSFPQECRYVLEALGRVYYHDAQARQQGSVFFC